MKQKCLDTIQHLLLHCGSLRPDESVVILCDESSYTLAQLFQAEAVRITSAVELRLLPLATRHGEEPDAQTADMMHRYNLCVSLCKYSLAHSQARVEAGKLGRRFLSLPLYTFELLDEPALSVDFQAQESVVRAVTDCFTQGKKVHIVSPQGTDITLVIDGRMGNCCPGFVNAHYPLGSPPDIEANVSPIESLSEGRVVIDGSITCPELGLLTEVVVITVHQGKIVSFESENTYYVETLEAMFGEPGTPRRVLAECGVGLNPLARLTGNMLTDEGAYGCVHFGFGSNYTVGGKNQVDFHLDFVFRQASIYVDDVPLMIDGELLYEHSDALLCR